MSSSMEQLQNAAYRGVQKFKHGIFSEIRIFYIARVVKYDKKNHVADVQPLANLSDGQESAQYLEVPVSENCYMLDEWFERIKPEFKKLDANPHNGTSLSDKFPKKKLMRKGVPVICAVLDRDNDNWNGKANTYDPNTSRLHDANDSIVIGVLGGDAVNG